MLRKPYFLARTTGNMELVWKKNNGPQYPTIHLYVVLLAIYSTFPCIRCTLGWYFFSGKVSDIFNLGVRSLVPSRELFHLWNVLIREPKQAITQSRSKFGVTWREARFHDSQYKKKRVPRHTRWKKFRYERKYEKEKGPTPTGFVWNTSMAAVGSFSWQSIPKKKSN